MTLITLLALSLNLSFSSVGPEYRIFKSKYDNGYSEQRYEFILNRIIEIYTPEIEKRGGSFHIMSDWTDGAVNMWAWRWGDEYWLEIPGGMARYHLIKEEGFLLSICHELGHLLGGAPGNEPISYEGQSDYYATLQCMKRVMPQITPEKIIKISQEVSDKCQKLTHISQDTCERSLEGALSLSSYYAELEKVSFPKISTPSLNKATQTLTVHPPAQCRLDTFVAGLACDQDIDTELSFLDPNLGTCQLMLQGMRPQCWFAY